MDRNVSAIILAGGIGSRVADTNLSTTPKQYLSIGGRLVLSYSVDVFLSLPFVREIIVVAAGEWIDYCKANIIEPLARENDVDIKLVEGGHNRQSSSLNGVKAASGPYVMIHDGTRPFVLAQDIVKLYELMILEGAAILGVSITDTIKEVSESGKIKKTIPRELLMSAVTPQAFRRDLILAAHEVAIKSNFSGTDDASLLEHMGENVTIILGSRLNIKITTREDLVYADFLARRA